MASFMDSVDSVQSPDDILKRSHIHFRRCLNFQAISPHLRSHNLLTDDEWEVISKKDTREQQADEFLKCLSHKGRNSLSHLINCLKLSQDHTGHQDILTEIEKQMSPTGSDIPVNLCTHDDSYAEDQDKFDKMTKELNTMYTKEKETVTNLKKKLKQKDEEIRQLHFNCDEQLNKIKSLEDTISAMKNDVENLKKELHEKETLLCNTDICTGSFADGDLFHSLGEISCDDAERVQRNIAESALCNSLPFISPGSPHHVRGHKRSSSDTGVPKCSERLPIEDKMKAYRKKLRCYHIKCQCLQTQKKLLEDEKMSLKAEKYDLQSEVHELKQILEVESISSRKSTVVSKDKFFPNGNLQDDAGDDAVIIRSKHSAKQETTPEGSYFSRFTAYIISPVKRLSRIQSELVSDQQFEILLPKDMDKEYLNPIYQGYLTKEGGVKKNLRKRWCVLASQYFFYFEGKDDPTTENKRPIGILPITKDMKVDECAKQNWFRVSMESGASMTSYKLDKSRTNYTHGNHVVYNLQASSDDDKKNWIKFFQQVIEHMY